MVGCTTFVGTVAGPQLVMIHSTKPSDTEKKKHQSVCCYLLYTKQDLLLLLRGWDEMGWRAETERRPNFVGEETGYCANDE